MSGYSALLFALVCVCAALVRKQVHTYKKHATATSSEFERFQRGFLGVYVLVTSADWVQGPYLYKLYSFYGFTKAEIGFLFVVGFFSSAVFGTLVGGLADRVGRKKVCLGFCALYAASCLTKHSSQFEVLLLGRALSGIATSILFSVFEAYMVHEHKRNAWPEEWLIKTLSYMTFSSSVAAVLCAVLAEAASATFGYVAPFDTAMVFLALGAGAILKLWNENYGDRSIAPGGNFAVGWVVMASNPKVWLLGLIQSCFEGAMYVFVFSWTPTLESSTDEEIGHGTVFACFMVCMMAGTSVYQSALKLDGWNTERVLIVNAAVAAASLALPAFVPGHYFTLLCFCLFEVCVGVYFPAMAYLRSKHIPDEVRATVLNFFRIPLNCFVVMVLLNIAHMTHKAISLWCAAILLASLAAQFALKSLVSNAAGDSTALPLKRSDTDE